MKRKLFTGVILLSFVTLTFMSCEKLDIPIETTLSTDIEATSATPGESSLKSSNIVAFSFEGTAIIDPTEDDDIDKYWNKIKSWEVKRIHNRIRSITESATLIRGELIVKDQETKAILFTKEVENVSLSNGADVMNIIGADYKKIVTALEDKHSLEVTIEGDVNKAGVVIVFALGFDVKVIANPLN